jgi:hypothetical protein
VRRTPRRLVALIGVIAVLGLIPSSSNQRVDRRDGFANAVHAAPRQRESPRLSRSKAAITLTAADMSDRVITPPPVVFDGPAAPTTPPPDALADHATTAVVPAGGVWAVIIGINDYPGTRSDLRSAVADAGDVDAALARYGVPAERRLVLTDGQADAATIEKALDWLVAHAAVDATAVLFYAGHVRKLDDDTEAIVGADGDVVRDEDVAGRLGGLRAHRAWIGVAACYGGGFTEALAPGRVLTAAADADSLAYENATYGRSYLVEYMVRRAMIESAADGSIEQAFAWAVDNLERDHPDRVPFQIDHADGDLVLGVPSAPASPPAGDPPAEPPPTAPADEQPSPDEQPPADSDSCVVRLGSLVTCPDD